MLVDIDQIHSFELPDEFDIASLKEDMLFKKEVTHSQRLINQIVSTLDDAVLVSFVKKLMLKMATFSSNITDSQVTKGVAEKDLTNLYKQVHEYSISAEYKMNCLMMFDCITDNHMIVCYHVLEYVRMFCIKKKVDLLTINSGTMPRRYVSDSSKARVRYVAGYCVAKLRHRYIETKKSNMHKTSAADQEKYHEAESAVDILNLLKEEEHYLLETTSNRESLLDVRRRQNVRCGLTNVTDHFFDFFLGLTEICLSLLINENLLRYGKQVYMKCFEEIYSDVKLFEQFIALVVNRHNDEKFEELDANTSSEAFDISDFVDNMVLKSAQILKIYQEVLKKYLLVLLAQFRKDVKSAAKMEKKMAHRKQIKVSKKSLPKFSDSQKTAHVLPEPIAGPSRINDHPVAGTFVCNKCNSDNEGQCIKCGTCGAWFHRNCAKLKTVRLWKKFEKDSAIWLCRKCLRK